MCYQITQPYLNAPTFKDSDDADKYDHIWDPLQWIRSNS